MPVRRAAVSLALVALGALVTLSAEACSKDERPAASASTSSGASSAPAVTGAAIAAEPSPGCRATVDSGNAAAPGETKTTLMSGGVERTYFLRVPPTYDAERATPLVLDFHGYLEGADLHRRTSQLGPFGDAHGFITVTPQGTGAMPFWDFSTTGRDVTFVDDLLDTLEQQLCIDQRRVYATGYSNGAMLSSALACARADRIAAIAPVAGILPIDGCAPSRPVPVIAFHGTEDPFVAFNGGLGSAVGKLPVPGGSGQELGQLGGQFDGFPAIPETMTTWAGRDGCRTAPTETKVTADVTLVAYDCPAPIAVELYRVEGGGHSWPGSEFTASIANVVGPTTTTIDADTLMWAFFEQHPRS